MLYPRLDLRSPLTSDATRMVPNVRAPPHSPALVITRFVSLLGEAHGPASPAVERSPSSEIPAHGLVLPLDQCDVPVKLLGRPIPLRTHCRQFVQLNMQ